MTDGHPTTPDDLPHPDRGEMNETLDADHPHGQARDIFHGNGTDR